MEKADHWFLTVRKRCDP